MSTSYYALFHTVLRAAAERFIGAAFAATGAYTILCRSFDHSYMNRVCGDLQKSTLRQGVKDQLRRANVSQSARDFAVSFQILQKARHWADYDPVIAFLPSDVASLIGTAEDAIKAFKGINPDEQADVLALLMVRGRE